MTLMQENAVPHIQELLALYNLSNAKENHLLIDAIQGIEFESTHKMMNIKPFPAFVRGIKVKVSIKAEVFRGHSLYIFSQLLSYVFNLKVQMNSFVDLIIFDDQSGQELYQCVQNVGGKKLL
jgi:type VI secretion system protein ImpG